ncbi:hypothetical protein [Synechococcus elongatus]|uniref:DUF4177 domain-containing protein n=1 Tax=Synechococcus elongatus PCC 11802 TaxID=2283154 RepID=A0AAT9K069_SYNEL|nr:hypothetical protein [Synechococcus elongatus]QFZ92739.1 hypothetical protein EKO22_10715 [Synechococcus elongatus PCC 11802]
MTIPRWQYRLICLSMGQTKSQGSAPPATQENAPAATPPEKLFSKPFLEQQFPEYYGEQAPRPLPSSGGLQQLIDLFNRLGSEGWEYYSREEIGGVNLLIFRRPLPDDAPSA